MNDKKLAQIGIVAKEAQQAAHTCMGHAAQAGLTRKQIQKKLRAVARRPQTHLRDSLFAPLAEALTLRRAATGDAVSFSGGGNAAFKQWGDNLDPKSVEQMERACSLPVAVRGALMPDAHVGYGLPIGGVLAVDNAVIPYAVGVDIACRMKLTVLDMPPEALDDERTDALRCAIETETRFGVGAAFRKRRTHPVMDRDWQVSPVTRKLKDRAWDQLGTSGSGNHFVEFGVLEIGEQALDLEPGRYLALMSHSGSRNVGAQVCNHYSKAAQAECRGLPRELHHLAWLSLDSHLGREYWAAMALMGEYAAANHELIHRHIAAHLGVAVLLDIENHHNFAWKERHDGRVVVVHRKGATPAAEGQLGIIPGSMATPAYIVRGKGNPESLESASHGAGRVMSRSAAKRTLRWGDAQHMLREHQVNVITAGIDEAPMVYKDIGAVMAAQRDLVDTLATFHPRLVKMAPAGERPED